MWKAPGTCRIALVAACCLAASAGRAQPPNPIEAELQHLVSRFNENRGFEGVVLVAEQGRVLYQGAFGLANREWQIDNTLDTRFLIASVTKPFTAALTMLCADRGLLQLNAPIGTYLDDYRADTASRITVHQLLTHTSGIPNYAVWPAFWDENPPRMKYQRAEFLQRYCSGDLLFEPGENSAYSDSNYYLLACIIEKVSGLTFEEALHQWILDPLGMVQSGIVREQAIIERRANGYLRRNGRITTPPYINYEDTQLGAGDMYASVGDLLRFDQALYDSSLLSSSSRAALFEEYAPSGFPGMFNGYGWNIGVETLRDSGKQVRVEHAPGNNNGFTTVLYRIPDTRHSIIVAENVGPGPLDMKVFDMCREILHVLYAESVHVPKPSIVQRLAAALEEENIDAARTQYVALKESGQYDLDPRGMNALGYRLLARDRVDEAIAVFTWNVESDPESANAYDSLGEGYMRRGDRQLAIQNYRTSLRLDPHNDNARRMLQQLGVDSAVEGTATERSQ